MGDDPLIGPPDRWIATLTEWAIDLRVDSFVFWLAATATEQVERFAAEIVPVVREAVAAARR